MDVPVLSPSISPGPRNSDAERERAGERFFRGDRHASAIAGAGPLVGPVLAMQMGYLPGTIWIIVGVTYVLTAVAPAASRRSHRPTLMSAGTGCCSFWSPSRGPTS